METLLQQILNLLIQPPGNLIYHLVLSFSIVSTLQAALIARRTSSYKHTNRLIFGLSMLLLGQVVLYLSSGLAWQGILAERLFLPPLDRAIVFFSLVWIVWLWNFPAPARLGDLVTGFLFLGALILFLFTYSNWIAEDPALAFNSSWIDLTWELSALSIVIIGMAVLLFSRPPGWAFGLSMLALSLAGLVAHLVLAPAEGYLSGFIRLGQLAAFPLLPTLLHRLNLPAAAPAPKPEQSAVPAALPFPRNQERRRYSSDPRTIHAWLELLRTDEPEKIQAGMAKALSHTMLADLCFIVGKPDAGYIILQTGYDLIREETIPGTMLEQNKLPVLSNAIQRAKQVRITQNDPQPAELKTLSSAIGITNPGSLMYIPLMRAETPHGGVLLLSPYSNRQWNLDDQNFLASEYKLVAQILEQFQQAEARSAEGLVEAELQVELENLRLENQKLLNQLATVGQNGQTQATTKIDLNALIAVQKEAQEQIAVLKSENERILAALHSQGISLLSPKEFERMEAELRLLLQEIAYLQNQLADSNARNLMLEREIQDRVNKPGEDLEVITSIVQEIRQPMASILGYTDLLLGESVGILGALQRNFLERIKVSTERMHSTMNDLIRMTTMAQGPIELLQQSVKLESIIDAAVADTSAQLREKSIALRVDLPAQLPEIYVDRDAVQQIVVHLLQNAGTITPQEGTITLHTRMKQENGEDYLVLQVADTGGGVHPDDLPRVFARRYRADMPLIQGLGDTGVGLSIAKTLVEAHGGRIWVDSTYGQSTTFSILLPVHPNVIPETEK